VSSREAIVLSRVGGRYQVFDEGETVLATIRGRIKRASSERVLVGDRVVIDRNDDGTATIEEVVPRRSLLKRRTPGKTSGVRPIAANLDQVIVVGAARRPDWDTYLIDRFIAVAEASDLPVMVVLNKADLLPDADRELDVYRAAGYSVLATSVPGLLGVEELRKSVAGRVSLFTGPSGAGKSSLLNLLEPGLQLRTGDVSRRAGTGRHTTVAAEMHPVAGGFVVDTPGLRDIGLWGLSPADVAAAFPELERWSSQCHFDNCRHLTEPKCAVVAAVARKEFSETRFSSYRRMLEEATLATRPWT
jgi:ribosome biogenesis GTPase